MGTALPYSFTRLLAAFIAFWLAASVMQGYLLFQYGFTWTTAGKDAVVSNGLLSLFGFLTMNMYRFYQPGASNKIYRFVIGLVIALIYVFVLRYVMAFMIQGDAAYSAFFERSVYLRFIFAFLIIAFITLINWLLNSVNEQKDKEKQESNVKEMLREAELARLRQQLQPHFLFNSLNSINALITSKPNEARLMVQQLSDFLRGTLKKDEQKLVPLKEEFEQLKLYLAIEKVRFGHRLNVELNVSEQDQAAMVPPLLLQPVVENAIKFGLYDTTGDITITLSTKNENGYLLIEVQNPYDASTQTANKGTGFGISSVKRRLYLLYARNDLMTTQRTETIFTTILKIPQ